MKENERINKEFRELRDLMNQDFKEKFEDMDHKVQRLNKRIFHLSLENKSLKSLVSSYHDPSNVSLEDVRAQIEEEMDSIGFRGLNREQRDRLYEIQNQLEDEEELSLQDLQFMLIKLQQMNQPTNEN